MGETQPSGEARSGELLASYEFTGEELVDNLDWSDLLEGRLEHGSPTDHVEVTITYENHGERTVTGALLNGAGYGGHPTTRIIERDEPTTSAGSPGHMFLADGGGTLHALWNKSWEGRALEGYKYRVSSVTIEVYDKTPTCPICDGEMVHGHAEWDPYDPGDGYSSGLLCPECFPVRITEGIV